MKIKKAIIPAAGLGTRFLPITKSQPKEMLPIVDKPCIQYLVEEAINSGIKEIIIITGDGKRSIEDYFNPSPILKTHLKEKGQKEALKEIERIEKLAKFTFIRQPSPKGDGDAILCAAKLVKNEPFAVLFGDDIYDSKIPPLAQMIKHYEKLKSPIIALTEIDKKECHKYGMVKSSKQTGSLHNLSDLIEKPKIAPSNLAITGKYIVTPELLQALKESSPEAKNKELRLIDGMKKYILKKPIYGCKIKGIRFDTGDKLGYLKAVFHFSLKHKDLSQSLKVYLKNII
ncbi:UTP--glucose-1-phosphate uridylyltransferase [Candidatus Peregrinibacteria bacterium CG10_big_fil_rev_8_21_14_0_10_36_19]|nr:MAG: UTP--glucose-1-phosphate uridylyltransferase [Candidatus Peregrinibacteria bacterium CG10_big_fil_rev_8_21_14_0_10_36_19]